MLFCYYVFKIILCLKSRAKVRKKTLNSPLSTPNEPQNTYKWVLAKFLEISNFAVRNEDGTDVVDHDVLPWLFYDSEGQGFYAFREGNR